MLTSLACWIARIASSVGVPVRRAGASGVAVLFVLGCGSDFSEGSAGSKAGDAGVRDGATTKGGSGEAAPKSCSGPEDCDDGNACTKDLCEGSECKREEACAGGLRCCNGECAECCGDSDCNDGVACTAERCFAGKCVIVPDHELCSDDEYCLPQSGCRKRESCSAQAACDDANLCTSDACEGGLCRHDFCSSGQVCCAGAGCRECCNDSHCSDSDPCTVDACGSDGRCSHAPKCGAGQKCCGGTCASCCTSAECADTVGCTDDGCLNGVCAHQPNPLRCPPNQTCSPVSGCVPTVQCTNNADCNDGDPCTTTSCAGGRCQIAGCAAGTQCCPGLGCRKMLLERPM